MARFSHISLKISSMALRKIFDALVKLKGIRKNSNFPLFIANVVFQYLNLLLKYGGILVPNRLLRTI